MKILVAEDDPIVRLFVAACLRAQGHEVVACESGTDAWNALGQSPFPVLITDWSMPGMDGIELTRTLRNTPRDSYTYIIMLTGHSTRDDYLTGVNAGVDAFLVKPVDEWLLEAQLHIATRIVGLEEHASRLETIVTVCSYCKRVRRESGWVKMEQYMASEFKALPSHTYCPTCYEEKVEPQLRALGV